MRPIALNRPDACSTVMAQEFPIDKDKDKTGEGQPEELVLNDYHPEPDGQWTEHQKQEEQVSNWNETNNGYPPVSLGKSGGSFLKMIDQVPPMLKWAIVLVLPGMLIVGGLSLYNQYASQPEATPTPTIPPSAMPVSALGRLEPQGETITVSAPSSIQGERLEELVVKEGDKLVKDQVIAILDSRDRLTAELAVAQQQVKIAQAGLAQVQSGAKAGDIAAQQATIDRLEAQLPRDVAVQDATISRLDAQLRGDTAAQQATIDRLQAQVNGDIAAQQATIERLQAQLRGDIAAQQATIDRLEAQLEKDTLAQEATVIRLEAQWLGDVAAQEATIARLVADMENAQEEYRRYEQLYKDGAVSASLFDSKALAAVTARENLAEAQVNLSKIDTTGRKQVEEAKAILARIEATGRKQVEEAKVTLERIQRTGVAVAREAETTLAKLQTTGREQLQEAKVTLERIRGTGVAVAREAETTKVRVEETGVLQIQEARAVLDSVEEVRQVDVQAAQAEVDRAIAAVAQAQINLDQATIKSPINGQVMKIHTRPGEVVGNNGIVDIGNTNQMYVVAEVYETDISRVRLGQTATITSDAFEGELQGTIDLIGLQVGKKDILDTDPVADVDVRVVEVKIRLNETDSQRVSSLTNLQVAVKIQP